jgi:hypothetical protein
MVKTYYTIIGDKEKWPYPPDLATNWNNTHSIIHIALPMNDKHITAQQQLIKHVIQRGMKQQYPFLLMGVIAAARSQATQFAKESDTESQTLFIIPSHKIPINQSHIPYHPIHQPGHHS